jgi:hypothetical protein
LLIKDGVVGSAPCSELFAPLAKDSKRKPRENQSKRAREQESKRAREQERGAIERRRAIGTESDRCWWVEQP